MLFDSPSSRQKKISKGKCSYLCKLLLCSTHLFLYQKTSIIEKIKFAKFYISVCFYKATQPEEEDAATEKKLKDQISAEPVVHVEVVEVSLEDALCELKVTFILLYRVNILNIKQIVL